MVVAGQGEGSTEHILVALVMEELLEYKRGLGEEEGQLQRQTQLVYWKGSCGPGLFLLGILLQNGLAVYTHNRTDLGSSSPSKRFM